ncbi:hypothetical protein NE237_016201 [Protea cynaroides]|uniref:Semialdehyde dehydrogenase NAD-binding domain-containing protein n=1 Tax=Protea cynaroides TaxID=273540 RepID=A0A9Q0KFJ2_9MAGN|nr:hypothetical protein NE237_016201 [Protea cynaroides]
MQAYLGKVKELTTKFQIFKIYSIDGKYNSEVDELSKLLGNNSVVTNNSTYLCQLDKPSIAPEAEAVEKEFVIEEQTPESFDGVEIVLFSARVSISKQLGPIVVQHGLFVVDNNIEFQMDGKVPLVIPEVNPDAMEHIKLRFGEGALIANPVCSTIKEWKDSRITINYPSKLSRRTRRSRK